MSKQFISLLDMDIAQKTAALTKDLAEQRALLDRPAVTLTPGYPEMVQRWIAETEAMLANVAPPVALVPGPCGCGCVPAA